jgi:hypothetical protein
MQKVHITAPVWGPDGQCQPGDIIEVTEAEATAMAWAVERLEEAPKRRRKAAEAAHEDQ